MHSAQGMGKWVAIAFRLCAVLVAGFLAAAPSHLFAAPREKTLTMAYISDVVTLDPHLVARPPDYPVAMNLFNGLVRYKQDSAKIEIEPDLATDWDISADGLVYTFRLRRGVRFHKGFGELTARDVKFSLERHLDPRLRSPFAGDMRAVERVDAVDEHTVRIRLREPYADFLTAVLAYRPGYVVSQRAVQQFGDRFGTNPVGTGPFLLESHAPRERIVFAAHNDYFRGRPGLDRVVLRVIPEETVTVLAMARGEIDYTVIRTAEAFRLLKLHPSIGYTATPVTASFWVIVNTQRPPMNDVRLRRALSHAVNREELAKRVLEGLASADDGIWSVIPPGMFGHIRGRAYPYDPDRARTLLTDAGLSSGARPLTMLFRPANRLEATALQGYWEKIGVKVNILEMDTATLTAYRTRGDWDMDNTGPFRVAPDQYLAQLLSISDPNFYGQLDDLILAQRREVNETKRKSLLRQIQLRVMEDLPFIPLYRPILVTAFRKGVVSGDVPNTHYWLFFWERMEVRK